MATLAVFLVNGTIGAYSLDFPSVVSSFEPLDKQEKLLYVEDRTTNETIASIYSGETREENLVYQNGRSQRFGPLFTSADGRKVFLKVLDSTEPTLPYLLIMVDGLKGLVLKLAQTSGPVSVSSDTNYLTYLDQKGVIDETRAAGANMTKIVVLKLLPPFSSSSFLIQGTYRQIGNSYFQYGNQNELVAFNVTTDDYHRETYEIDLATDTMKRTFRSKGIDAGK